MGKGSAAAIDVRDEQLARYAKALGHPARVLILRHLIRVRGCVCGELVEELPLAQSTVSQHLKVLRDAGLITGTIDGPRVCYCVEPKALEELARSVSDLVEGCVKNLRCGQSDLIDSTDDLGD